MGGARREEVGGRVHPRCFMWVPETRPAMFRGGGTGTRAALRRVGVRGRQARNRSGGTAASGCPRHLDLRRAARRHVALLRGARPPVGAAPPAGASSRVLGNRSYVSALI